MKSTIIRFLSVAAKVILFSTVLGTIPLAQANITVTSLADNGPGSLRQAIADAAPGEMIDFSVTGTITLTSGELAIAKNLTINGPGATNLTVGGNNLSRVFDVLPGVNLAVSGLTIADGAALEGDGGGIFNFGNLVLTDCIVRNCWCYWGPYGGGGGIWNGGGLNLVRCTISGNRCVATGTGGGIFSMGSFSASNCTISGNFGPAGGGITFYSGGPISLKSCTISSNIGDYWGPGIVLKGATLTMRNTIIAGNGGSDCDNTTLSGVIFSEDYNLIGNTNGAIITGSTTHNIYGQDPLLGPLADNGGATPTHALRFDSPAVDAGNSVGLSTDQRGFPRPIDCPGVANANGGDGSDIGAYEVNPSTQMSIYTAVEVGFGTTLGRTYRVESSTDMATWSQVETGIVGTGGQVTRLYTVRIIPKRFFQAVQE